MHHRFLVTCKSSAAHNSTQARQYVARTLYDEGFVWVDGRSDSGMCDWFVIGGRWSGELSRHTWAALLSAPMDALEQQHGVGVFGVHYTNAGLQHLQRDLAARFQQMWDAAAPRAFRGLPIQRDTYKEDGYEDDAMLLTQDLFAVFLKEYAGAEDSDYHADLDHEPIASSMVGKKWLVVVDYHI